MKQNDLVQKLMEIGYLAKQKSDFLLVPVSLGTNIHIYYKDGAYKVEPRFGMVKRSVTVSLECIIFLGLLPVFIRTENNSARFTFAVIMTAAIIWDVVRFKQTNRAKEQIDALIRANS